MPPLPATALIAALACGACQVRPGDDDRDSAGGYAATVADSAATLTAVRTAVGAGSFERIVFAFADSDLPPYAIEYVADPPTACGSGRMVDASGGAYLTVRFSPARAHRLAPHRQISTLDARRRQPNGSAIRRLTLTCDFEGVVEWAVELDERRPYRVRAMDAPTRLVLAVQRNGSP